MPCPSCSGAQGTARGEEEDGDRQEEDEEVKREKSNQGDAPMNMDRGVCIMKSCGKMRAGSVHVVIRHASVEVQVHCVNVVIGVLVVHVVLLVIRVVPVLLVML